MSDTELRTATEKLVADLDDNDILPIAEASPTGLFRVKLGAIKAFILASVFPAFAGANKLLATNSTNNGIVWVSGGGGGGGAVDFTDLGDVPAAYTGEGGKIVAVKSDESGLEFVTGGGGGGGGSGIDFPPASTKWRARMPGGSRDDSYGTGFSEFKWLDASANNLVDTIGGTPFCSQEYAGGGGAFALAKAFDGSTASGNGWYSSAFKVLNVSIGFEFASAVTPASFSACPLHDFPTQTWPEAIIIEYYDADTAIWMPVDSFSMGVGVADAYQGGDIIGVLVNDRTPQTLVIGDSITALAPNGINCVDEINLKLNTTHFVANGLSGRKMNDAIALIGGLTLTGVKRIIIDLGTNDYGLSSGRTLGALGDISTANTFFGDIDGVVKAVYAKDPKIVVGFVTPIQRFDMSGANGVGATLQQYADAVISGATAYGCPALDMYRNGGFNSLNHGDIMLDNLHPNGLGMKVKARRVAHWSEGI